LLLKEGAGGFRILAKRKGPGFKRKELVELPEGKNSFNDGGGRSILQFGGKGRGILIKEGIKLVERDFLGFVTEKKTAGVEPNVHGREGKESEMGKRKRAPRDSLLASITSP